MGLPMWREPDEVSEEDTATRVERTAATRRSAIRRRRRSSPTTYNNNNNYNNSNATTTTTTASVARNNVTVPPYRPVAREEFPEVSDLTDLYDADRDIARLEAELERLRRYRVAVRGRTDAHRNGVAARRREWDVGVSLREVAQRPGNTPPVPRRTLETALRLAADPPQTEMEPTATRRFPALPAIGHALPSYPRAGSVRPPDDGLLRRVPDGPAELTPDFAPARGVHVDAPRTSESRHVAVAPIHGSTVNMDESDIATDSGDEAMPPLEEIDSFQQTDPLTRLQRLEFYRQRRHYFGFDGMGDRQRSPTPISTASDDSTNEDHWQALYPTMGDTGSRPSAHSSFTTTATTTTTTTSASASRSNGSSQTVATSFGEISQADESCDLDLAPGITEEDVRRIRERHRGTRRIQVHSDARRSPRPATRVADGDWALVQDVLERMARREDIPDEFWAAAGLARAV